MLSPPPMSTSRKEEPSADLPIPSILLSDALLFADPSHHTASTLACHSEAWRDALVLATPLWGFALENTDFIRGKDRQMQVGTLNKPVNLSVGCEIPMLLAESFRFDAERLLDILDVTEDEKRMSESAQWLLQIARRVHVTLGAQCPATNLFEMMPSLIAVQSSDSSGLKTLNCFSSSSLVKLDLRLCRELTDISAIRELSSLSELSLWECHKLEDFSPLRTVRYLSLLRLGGCHHLIDAAPLADVTSLQKLYLSENPLANAAPMSSLKWLTSLTLKSSLVLDNVEPFAELTAITKLNLRDCSQITDISPFGTLKKLEVLNLSHCSGISDVSVVRTLDSLTELELASCAVVDVSPLASCSSLTRLGLRSNWQLTDISSLVTSTSLRYLDLRDCSRVESTICINQMKTLRELNFDFNPWHLFGPTTHLRTLHISCRHLSDVYPLIPLHLLEELYLREAEKLSDITDIKMLKTLRVLHMTPAHKLRNLAPLSSLSNLRDLLLHESPLVEDISPLASLTQLESLNLRNLAGLCDISPLGPLTRLVKLDLSSSGVNDLAPLATLVALRVLKLQHLWGRFDFSPLESLKALRKLYLNGTVTTTGDAVFFRSVLGHAETFR